MTPIGATRVALALWLALGHGAAQADDWSYMNRLREAENANLPLAAFDHPDTLSPAQLADLREHSNLQMLGTFRSLAGDADGAARA